MLRKIELDALRADLGAINAMLASRTEADDPIGFHQFQSRKREIEEMIAKLGDAPDHTASVGLFFGGLPVIGSRGIRADFAGKAIEYFQELVAKQHAAAEAGILGRRGRVPLRAATDLMLTDVVRGSFGMVLEEVEENGLLADSKVKQIVDEVTDVFLNVASIDDQVFEELLASIDGRLLSTLRDFFHLLDEGGATIRVVEAEKDRLLDRDAVHRGRVRTEAIAVDERESDQISGKLYLLPAHRRFELVRDDTGETIYGIVSPEYSKEYLGTLQQQGIDPVGKTWRTKMLIREIKRPNREPKITYTLLGLLGELNSNS